MPRGSLAQLPEPAKAEFQRLIARAQQQITDHAQLLASDTTTHIYLVMIGRSAGWTIAQQRAVVEDAVARSTRDELDLYEELATSMLPKWGGDWDALANFIDEVDVRTSKRRGHELYAYLWSMVADNLEGNLFKNTRADWSRIKEGMERSAAAHRHRWFANRLAYLACLAEDRATMKAALARADGEPDVEIWAGGGAGGPQNYEACTRWAAGAGEPEVPKPKVPAPIEGGHDNQT